MTNPKTSIPNKTPTVHPTSSQPNFGLPTHASIAINTVVTGQFTVVETLGEKAFGKFGGPVVSGVIGLVDVVDAYRNGTTNDVIVQSSGVSGSLGGGFLAGAGVGAAFGAAGANPVTVAFGTVIGGVAGAYFGEKAVQDFVQSHLSTSPVQVTTHFAIGTVSSARIPGQTGLVRSGYEMNALDVIADQNHRMGIAVTANSIDAAQSAVTPTHSPSPATQAKAQAALASGIYPDAILRGAAGHGGGASTSSTSASNTGNNPGNPNASGYFGGGHPTGTSPSASTPNTGNNPGNPNAPGYYGGGSAGGGASPSSGGMGMSIGPNGITPSLPVVLDLNGNGVEISLSYKAAFDYNGNGFRQPTAWVAPSDGFLVIDLNADGTRGAGDGKIDQAKELVLSQWGPAGSTDLQAVEGNNGRLPMAA